MHQGQLVFAQLMRHLPLTTFRRCVARYAGEHKVKSFSCHDQYLCMAFAQLTYRESLRDIEASLRAQSAKLYHLGIRGNVARNTLAKRQCDARLAYLRELRRAVDWYRARLVCRGTLRCGSGRDGLRTRCDDHRFVLVGISVGVQRDGHGIVLVTYRADPVYIIGGFLEVCDILSSLTEVIATRVNVAET